MKYIIKPTAIMTIVLFWDNQSVKEPVVVNPVEVPVVEEPVVVNPVEVPVVEESVVVNPVEVPVDAAVPELEYKVGGVSSGCTPVGKIGVHIINVAASASACGMLPPV